MAKIIKKQENKISQLQNNEIRYDVKRLKVPDLKKWKKMLCTLCRFNK